MDETTAELRKYSETLTLTEDEMAALFAEYEAMMAESPEPPPEIEWDEDEVAEHGGDGTYPW